MEGQEQPNITAKVCPGFAVCQERCMNSLIIPFARIPYAHYQHSQFHISPYGWEIWNKEHHNFHVLGMKLCSQQRHLHRGEEKTTDPGDCSVKNLQPGYISAVLKGDIQSEERLRWAIGNDALSVAERTQSKLTWVWAGRFDLHDLIFIALFSFP